MTETENKILRWLAGGDTGVSSESIAFAYSGIIRSGPFGCRAPSDPDDLGRCLRLIKEVPECRKDVNWLAEHAPESTRWKAAALVWDEIAACMDDEVGIDWSKGRSAPKTYEMMKAAGL